jgi:histone-lysine N-methyltransferase SUV420H
MTTALQRLTEQFDVSRYIRTLTEDAAKSFLGHCTQYLSLYLPDCPFEIVETTKYGRAGEMAIRARKAISTGETINYLEGRMVPASEADIHDQQRQGQVVSVLESGRFRGAFVLSSLARFANHECHANSQLYRLSRTRLVIRAVRSIKVGDEVTVNYGEGYFGSGNADCRCTTCQRDDQEVRYDGGREGGDTIRCPLCHWDYVLTASTNVCPSCSRHFFLYGQFWPYSIPRDGYASEGLRSANL